MPSLKRSWTPSGVCKILSNPVYLGHTVQGKNEKPSFRSERVVSVSKERWIVVKNTHEALVDEETFLLARRRGREG